MRTFEIGLLLMTLAVLVMAWWPYERRRPSGSMVGGMIFLGLLVGQTHLLSEGYRWQMWGTYLLFIGGSVGLIGLTWWRARRLWRPRKRWQTGGSAVGLLLLWGLAVLVPWVLPVPELMPPSGPYTVGTRTFYMVDESREETHTEDPDDKRELMVQIWYPAARPTSREATYVDDASVTGPAVAEQFGLPSFMLNHMNLARTYTYVDAAVAEEGPFPTVVFVHGLSGLRGQNMFQIAELVSHGYVVISADHPYGNVATVYPDGRVAAHDSSIFPEGETSPEGGRFLIDIWWQDVGFVLDQMPGLNGTDGIVTLAGQMDLERLGVMGHSTGGGTMWVFCQEDPRCDAGLGLDAWLRPIPDYVAAVEREVPMLFMSTPTWLGEENLLLGEQILEGLGAEGSWFTLDGSNHYTFSDFPFLTPLSGMIGLTGELPVARGGEIINAYTVAFFDKHLKEMPDDGLLEGDPVYDEVNWR